MTSYDGNRDPAGVSARDLTVQLGEQMSRLARHEIALANAELFADARQAGLGCGLLSAAAVAWHAAWLAMATSAAAPRAWRVRGTRGGWPPSWPRGRAAACCTPSGACRTIAPRNGRR